MLRGFYDALDTLLNVQKAFEAAHGADYFGISTTSNGLFPSVNLFRKGDDIILTAEIPGMKKEDIRLEIKDHLIRISGKKETEYPEASSVHRMERSNMKFDRSIKLPVRVNLDRIEARHEDGILTVTLPRAEEDKPKQISVH